MLRYASRAYLFKRARAQVEHILTMANLELQPSPFTPALLHCIIIRVLIANDRIFLNQMSTFLSDKPLFEQIFTPINIDIINHTHF